MNNVDDKKLSLFKKSLFIAGLILLAVSLFENPYFRVTQNTLILFGFLLLIAFFDELQEFDFFGLRGKKVEKKLEQLQGSIKNDEDIATVVPDDVWKVRNANIGLIGLDHGNFLALVFESERLLRGLGQLLYPESVHESTPAEELGDLLQQNDYLTEHGALLWNTLLEVRTMVISGTLAPNDEKLVPWIAVAERFYEEIAGDIRKAMEHVNS